MAHDSRLLTNGEISHHLVPKRYRIVRYLVTKNDMYNLDGIAALFVGWLNCFGSNTEIGIYQDHAY